MLFTVMPLNRSRPRVWRPTLYLNPGTKAKVLAEKIQAVLVEAGFVDNTGDNQLFDTKKDEIVSAIVGAILEQLGIEYLHSSPPPPFSPAPSQVLYRVMAGSYAVRENADRQVQKLKDAGFDATIMIFKPWGFFCSIIINFSKLNYR